MKKPIIGIAANILIVGSGTMPGIHVFGPVADLRELRDKIMEQLTDSGTERK